jgi:uncharacterized SAM-binding protein YcdF (DUF218 family)
MFFALSKTLSLLVLPSNFLILLGIAGLLLLRTRWRRAGKRLTYTSLTLIALIGFLPFGTFALATLENRFPRWQPTGTPDGIIVLGGAIDPDLSAERGEAVLGSSLERLTVVPDLARKYPNARIVYSGGNGGLLGGPSEADVAGPLFVSLGVPANRILLERTSRNTAENAAFSKSMLDPKPGERWLLVTSAAHMPRAIGCFRAVGFPVEAYPVDWHTSGRIADWLLPNAVISSGLGRLDSTVREWIGLVAYRITGRTSALFPSP